MINRGGTGTIISSGQGSGGGSIKVDKVEIPPITLENEERYACPENCEPDVEYDEEGNCPVCGAPLETVESIREDDSGRQGEDPEEEDEDDEKDSDGNPDNTFNDDSN